MRESSVIVLLLCTWFGYRISSWKNNRESGFHLRYEFGLFSKDDWQFGKLALTIIFYLGWIIMAYFLYFQYSHSILKYLFLLLVLEHDNLITKVSLIKSSKFRIMTYKNIALKSKKSNDSGWWTMGPSEGCGATHHIYVKHINIS